ncbi:DUF983 domain-containing protein [Qipengyuania sp. JC766]|uniref:DUF983 domain-containing protein n=1 Tax=Qipengyuania sp. JC766 TaxID=3232139 RepID=UPI003459606F
MIETAKAAALGQCPRCDAPTLFDGFVKFAPRCRSCGLDYDGFNVGDGPAAFLTFVIGAFVVGLALWLDAAVRHPFWVHAIIWIPVTFGLVFAGLRVAKGMLLHLEFRRRAGEGKGGS